MHSGDSRHVVWSNLIQERRASVQDEVFSLTLRLGGRIPVVNFDIRFTSLSTVNVAATGSEHHYSAIHYPVVIRFCSERYYSGSDVH